PHRASMRPSNRPAGHRPHGPSMNTIRPNMNVKTQYRAPWVPTVNRNNPPVNRKFSTGKRNFPTVNRKFPTASRKITTGSTKIHTADIGKKGKAATYPTSLILSHLMEDICLLVKEDARLLEREPLKLIILTKTGNPVKKILLKLNLSDHKSILTDLQVTPTKPGRMTKPYSSHRFIANCFNAGNLKMEVKVPGSAVSQIHNHMVIPDYQV
nr:hypothetical protein [Tanacetum cinerariifolium]